MPKTQDGKAEWHFELPGEVDESYHDTTCHASITCKCGKKVWYGCGKNQTTRPLYCKSCTLVELKKLKCELSYAKISDKTDEQLITTHLRRAIPSETKKKESVN